MVATGWGAPAARGQTVVHDREAAHALIEAELRWTDAVRRGDRATASSFMTAEFTSVAAGPKVAPVGRVAWLGRVSVPSTLEAFEYDDFRVRVIDDVALVQSRCRERGAGSGTHPETLSFRFTDVWRRSENRWRIDLRHVSFSPI